VIAMFGTLARAQVSGHIGAAMARCAGLHGWLQPIADGVKLLRKEDLVPLGADRVLYDRAGFVLASILAAMAVYPPRRASTPTSTSGSSPSSP
jgi:NADH-quinone oxidoreductase subunit H